MFDCSALGNLVEETFSDLNFGVVKGLSPKDTGGPVVKTGPTAGQNRSRNNNGRWRKKRSDAGKSRL